MRISNTLYITNRTDWRAWLEKHHRTADEVWLVYYKKSSGRPTIPYDDSVEEALCFGWIDGILKSMDEEKYTRRFTPRRQGSIWSDLNRKRAQKMIKEGRMTEAGTARLPKDLWMSETAPQPKSVRPRFAMPGFFKEALTADKKARDSFDALAPSYRRMYVAWLATAKKDETRQRRLKEAMALLRKSRKLGLK